MRRQFCEGDASTDFKFIVIRSDRSQLFDLFHIDKHRRGNNTVADIDQQIGPPTQDPASGMIGFRAHQIGQRLWPQQLELRKRLHQ